MNLLSSIEKSFWSYILVFNKSLFNLATLVILVCPFQRRWRIFSNGSNQNSQSTWEGIFFMLKWLLVGSFFPRLPNSFFFFQKIKRFSLRHKAPWTARSFGVCRTRAPTQISHSLQYHSVFPLCLLSDKRENKAVWCLWFSLNQMKPC